MLEKLMEEIDRTDVYEYGLVSPKDIEYRQDIREICEDNKCRKYGTTWACPPAIGTIDECRKRAFNYDNFLVFTAKYELKTYFDYRGMIAGMSDFKRIAFDVEEAVKPYLKDYIILSNESCETCDECTYPDKPCRFPDKLHHSIEGYGIVVNELAKKANINYNNGEKTVTYFGGLLFNNE